MSELQEKYIIPELPLLYDLETKEPSFSFNEVSLFNRLMDETFDVCENNDKDIFAIGFDNLMNEFELFQISV